MNYVTARFSIIIIIFITSISTSTAYAEAEAKTKEKVATHPAERLVNRTTASIFSQIKKNKDAIKKDPKLLHQLVSEVVLPHFDFDKMSSWALGKYWREANKDQKIKFTEQFRALLVRTYANALASNTDQKIKYLPIRIKNEKKVTVRTEIEQKGTFPLPINYRMHLIDNEWKVYDVNIDSVSMVKNFQSSFANEIRKSNIDKLIKQLTERNQKAISG
ncbi:MAG: ABC transporter substrate-binding protein [Gammaproteobacteria bacterium]|nr:ABC transporter substrate-binding protein [Gammaproteobacteria bacterium]